MKKICKAKKEKKKFYIKASKGQKAMCTFKILCFI